jgi:hypothetical protein
MNNVSGSTLSDTDTKKIMQAADVLIATVRAHRVANAQLELESFKGEKWRITIECLAAGEEAKQ